MKSLQLNNVAQKKASLFSSNVTIKKILRAWQLYLMLLLPMAYILVFAYYPMLGAQIAFKDFKANLGIWGSQWVGLKYFKKFFSSYQCWRVISNTLTLSVYSLAASFPCAIILALSLNCAKGKRLKKIVQTVTYLPHFISVVVLVGMMFQIFNPIIGTFGILYRRITGLEAPNIMGNPYAFFHMYVWSNVWQHMGWDSIIYVAALSAVDTELYEAAQIDGASRWQMLWKIDIPSIMPTIVIMLILKSGQIMNVGYEKTLLLQNDFNIRFSEVISTFVYKQGLGSVGNYSYATAIGLFNSVINYLLILLVNKISQKAGESSLW